MNMTRIALTLLNYGPAIIIGAIATVFVAGICVMVLVHATEAR